MVPQLYINGRFLLQKCTGVERYAYNLSKALVELGADPIFLCPTKGEIQSCYETENFHIVRFGCGSSHFWEQAVFPFYFIGKSRYVLLNFTGLGPLLISKKMMTIHDLSFLENPKWFSKLYTLFYRWMTPLAIRSSREVLTVSNFSRQDILRHYPFLEDSKVNVIYNAVNAEQFQDFSTQMSKPHEEYFLAVSSLDPRKNLFRLIEAFTQMPSYKLKIVGDKNRIFSTDGTQTVDAPNVQFLGRVSDQELQQFYVGAKAFIYPSIFEGFGLPPIEAMAANCPTLVSDIPVLHETCGDASIFFDPFKTESICNTLKHFCSLSEREIEDLRIKGHRNIQRFSWQTSAKKILQLIHS